MHALLLVVSRGPLDTLARESGLLEISQIAILLFAGILAGLSSKLSVNYRTAAFTLSGILLCAASREADDWFAILLFDDAYKWLVCLPVITIVGWRCWDRRDTIYKEFSDFLRTPFGSIFTFAILFVGLFCNLLDRSSFWPAVLAAPELANQKTVIEESAELFGYLIILIAINELLIHAWLERVSQTRKSTCELLTSNAIQFKAGLESPLNSPDQSIKHDKHPTPAAPAAAPTSAPLGGVTMRSNATGEDITTY